MHEEIARLATEYHDFRQRVMPIVAHLQGDYRFADRAPDPSRASEDAQIAESRTFAARAATIPDDGLDTEDRLTRDILGWDASIRADLAGERLAEIAVDPLWGPQVELPVAFSKLALPTREVAGAMPDKLHGIAREFRDLGERHREGKALGRLPVRVLVDQTIAQLDDWLARPVEHDPLLVAPPAVVTGADAWTAAVRAVIESDVRPAVAGYRNILRDELLAVARPEDRAGLCWIPGGDEAYATAIRYNTTLSRSPKEIHGIGLAEIARLADEYRQVGSEALGTSDLESILEALRSDPSLRHTSGRDIVEASARAIAKARAAMGEWFGVLPRAECEVEEVKSSGPAYYLPPSNDGTRGGVVFWNTTDPTTPCFVVETVSYHEGIPGHHLQIAIAAELERIPEFRRGLLLPAYAEGWALYAERLADEMGLFSTPLDRLGMLGNESLRACRLVVDTGLHALGWSRRRAIEFMVRNSPMPEGFVTTEIDYELVDPAQSLAYMLGRHEILRMRADARARLGRAFDIRAFHDTVLGSGAMPLPLLNGVVRAWIDEVAQA